MSAVAASHVLKTKSFPVTGPDSELGYIQTMHGDFE